MKYKTIPTDDNEEYSQGEVVAAEVGEFIATTCHDLMKAEAVEAYERCAMIKTAQQLRLNRYAHQLHKLSVAKNKPHVNDIFLALLQECEHILNLMRTEYYKHNPKY